MIAFVVDKTIRTRKGKAAWVAELLSTAPEGELAEVGLALKASFDKKGSLKDTMDLESLGEDTIAFIHTLKMWKGHKGTGEAQQALKAFHNILSSADAGIDATAVLLSPARSGKAKPGEPSDVEVEQKLIKVYEKSGYKVLLKGDEDVEDSLTLMGRKL